MARTCCPLYTIRLDAKTFKPGKKHRQVMNRFNRFLSTGFKPGERNTAEIRGNEKAKGRGKGKGEADGSWVTGLREYEVGHGREGRHRFETTLDPAEGTPEKFELYKRYQTAVHHEPPEEDAPIGLKSGLKYDRLPSNFGSFHLLYRVDDKLIGISVIDILPLCVSSVYFIWDPDWAWASLGKISALWETALALDMADAGMKDMGWLYMGYWLPNCVKARYKSEYAPSYLLDPGTNIYHQLSEKIDRYLQAHPRGYRPFAQIEAQEESAVFSEHEGLFDGDGAPKDVDMEAFVDLDLFPSPPPPGFGDPSSFDEQVINNLLVFLQRSERERASPIVKYRDLAFNEPERVMEQVRQLAAAVGICNMASTNEEDVSDIQNKGLLFFG